MIETLKIVQALYYVLTKIGTADKLKLVKLLYLADEYHLLKYGRTVTGDEYWAMSWGPVGSVTKDILSFDDDESTEYKYISRLIKKINDYTFKAQETEVDLDMLSETDIEALDFIVKHFGAKTKDELIRFTHKYPEWKQYERLFKEGFTRREKINTIELFERIDDDPFDLSPDHIEESKKIYSGLL